jgi:long-chain acyl-CoA synthetase
MSSPPPGAKLITPEEAVALLASEPSPYAVQRESIGGVEFNTFKYGPRTLPVLFSMSRRHDDKLFLVYEDELYTFAQARERAAGLAHALMHELNVQKGDRVVLAMRNFPEWCFGFMAATSIGAVIVPLNAWWTEPELRYGIADCGAKVALVDPERLARIAPFAHELGLSLVVARPDAPLPKGAHDMQPMLQNGQPLPAVDVRPEDDATIMYTSGSTGHPKGAVSSQLAVTSSVFAWEFVGLSRLMTDVPPEVLELIKGWLSRGAEALNKPPLEPPQRSTLMTLPLFHVTGCNVMFLPSFRAGRKIVLMRKWNPERALELIEREKITDFGGVPTMSWELVNSPDFGKRDISTLQSLSSGGAARPPDQVQKLKDRVAHARPSSGYGMTETGSLGAAIGGDDYLLRPASVGRALPPLIELKVVDSHGDALGTDLEGEIGIKGVSNMRAYWNRPEETRHTLIDGYVMTGDLGRIDSDGYLFITGRAKDIVIRGGENISCPEVEHALYEHPAVFEAAAYGVSDDRLGEALAATVMVRSGHEVTAHELQLHVRSKLAAFKVPSVILLQRESLPRVASGKIDKRAVKKAAEAHLAFTRSKPPSAPPQR